MPLIRIRPGVLFRPDAAASFRRLEATAGRQLDVNRTVVSYDEQATLYAHRLRGQYPYPVAHPKYSNHVYRDDDDGGNAWDTDERGDWLDEHGWIADVPGEPWHREYRPSLDRHRFDPTPATTTTDQEEDMFINIQGKAGKRNGGAYYIANGVATFLGASVAGLPTLSDANADKLATRVTGI